MTEPFIPPDRGEHRSLAVRNWHREALDGWAKAYDLDCSGEFAGKCAKCLQDLYAWEDSRNPMRATSYTKATAHNLGCPGFFIHFAADESDHLLWMKVWMIHPQRIWIGGAEEFASYLAALRRFHKLVWHEPAVLCGEKVAA